MADLSDEQLWHLVVRVHPEAAVQRVGDRLLAVSPDDFLHTFEDEAGVSEVAERIVELADGTRTVADISARLCDEFEVEAEACARDTRRFVKLLLDKRVLTAG